MNKLKILQNKLKINKNLNNNKMKKNRKNLLQFFSFDETPPFKLDDDGEPKGGISLDVIRWECSNRDGAEDDPEGYDFLDRYMCELFYIPDTRMWVVVAYEAMLPIDTGWNDYFDWSDDGPVYFVLTVVDDIWPIADKRFKHQADINGNWFKSPRVETLSLHDSVLHIRNDRRRSELCGKIKNSKRAINGGWYTTYKDRFLSTFDEDMVMEYSQQEVESVFEQLENLLSNKQSNEK